MLKTEISTIALLFLASNKQPEMNMRVGQPRGLKAV